jgi:hypothetical protein
MVLVRQINPDDPMVPVDVVERPESGLTNQALQILGKPGDIRRIELVWPVAWERDCHALGHDTPLLHNVMPLSGRGGARATLDRK